MLTSTTRLRTPSSRTVLVMVFAMDEPRKWEGRPRLEPPARHERGGSGIGGRDQEARSTDGAGHLVVESRKPHGGREQLVGRGGQCLDLVVRHESGRGRAA